MARKTFWHQEFLNLVAAGQSFDEAAPNVGTTGRNLYDHFKAFPEFRAAAMEARLTSGRPMSGFPADHSHVPRLSALISAGLTVAQTAYVLRIPPGTIQNWALLPSAQEHIGANRTGSKHGPRRWPVNIDDLLKVLRHLADGMSLTQACAAVTIPVPTMKLWRRLHHNVDAAVVAAAMDGRRRQIKPYPRLVCPGPRCGTGTGYDYGCPLKPCRTAAADRTAEYRLNREQATP